MALESRESRGFGRILAAAGLAALLASGGLAAEPTSLPAELEAGGTVSATRAVDGDTLELTDGRELRLVGLAVPQPPLETGTRHRAPLAEAAAAALGELALGHRLELGFGGRRHDRYGRLLAQVYRDDGLWLEGALLERGLARVETQPDNRALASAMLAREAAARASRRGLWAYRSFAVRSVAEARRHTDSFEIVEGRIAKVSRGGSRSYLAFGDDPRSGLTAILLPESRRLFTAAGLAPASLEGKRVRLRGVIRWWKGPVMDVTHPEQIELLGP